MRRFGFGLLCLLAGSLHGAPAGDPIQKLLQESEQIAPSDPARGAELAERAIAAAEQAGDEALAGKAHNRLGVALYYAGNYERAYGEYRAAEGIGAALDDKQIRANALNNIGVLFYLWGNLDAALDYYQQALALRDRQTDRAGVARALNNIGAVAHAAERFDEAIESFHKAIEVYEQLGDERLAISARNNVVLALLKLERFDDAQAELSRAMADAERIQDQSALGIGHDHRGRLLRATGDARAAREALQTALGIREAIGDKPGLADTHEHLAAVAADLGEYSDALAHLQIAITLARELDSPQLERDAESRRADIESARGDHAAALAAYQRADRIDQRLVSEASERRLAELRALLESERQAREIERLQREQRQRETWLIAASVTAVLLGLLVLQMRRQRQVERAARLQIEASRAELQAAHDELGRSSQAEMAHLARVASLGEMTAAVAHELNQPLSAILTNAQVASSLITRAGHADPALRGAIDDAALGARRAWEVLHHLRRLARRGEVERQDVALAALVQETLGIATPEARMSGVALRFDSDVPDLRVFADPVQLQQILLNLLQNAITATAENGPGGVVRVACQTESRDTVLRVSDEGPPINDTTLRRLFEPFFTTRTAGLGMGLAICRRLAEAHGGTLLAHRREDRAGGLVFVLRLPTPEATAAA